MKRSFVVLLLLLTTLTSCMAPTPTAIAPTKPAATDPAITDSPAVSALISPADAKAALDAGTLDGRKVVLVDVRTAEEFAEKRIPGSVLLPVDDITGTTALSVAGKEDAVIVYCRSGRRSAIAAGSLIALGYKRVYDLGGIQDWPYDTISG